MGCGAAVGRDMDSLVGTGMEVGLSVGTGAGVGVPVVLHTQPIATRKTTKANNMRYCDFMT